MRVYYAIVYVSDMTRSVAFYRDVLEIPLRFETPHWTEFVTDGATLALHVTSEAGPASDATKAEPAGRCRPGLHVKDLSAFHARMLEHKVPCVQPPKEAFGARMAQYVDPDGLILSVSEERRQS